MDEISKVLLGVVAGFVFALISERFKQIHASKTAAMMVVRELEFHKQRLGMAFVLDEDEGAPQYELMFPSPVWTANAATLVAGAPPQEAEAILNWYASMAVLGYKLGKSIGPEGPVLIGPNRERLQQVLTEAHLAAQRLAARWSLRKGRPSSPSLFDELTQ